MEDVPEVLALYDDVNRVIYVGESWTDQSPAHLSILVHEMVHHLQNISGIRYACPAAREALAYEVQDRRLDHFGREFVEEFGFDRFWLKVSTLCFWPWQDDGGALRTAHSVTYQSNTKAFVRDWLNSVM